MMNVGAAGQKYGFINDRDVDPNAYVYGGAQLPMVPLQPSGQWDEYLPQDEFQDLYGVEPYACATFGTLNCIETILRRQFTQVENYSDRYTAYITGTAAKRGNSPHVVAESIRDQGAVYEKDWPFTADISTFEKYYETPPSFLAALAERFDDEFDFGHEYLPTNASREQIKSALTLSPLGVSVYAWTQNDQGLYYKPQNARDNHWCMLYGYDSQGNWKVFDSYDSSHKLLDSKFTFEVIKRYHLQRTLKSQQQLSGLALILQKILAYLNSFRH